MRKLFLALFCIAAVACGQQEPEWDICVYGGNSAGVIAALSAKRMGKTVILIEPGNRLGGLSSGGLGYTDIGNKQVVSGLAKDFYRRLGLHYGKLEQWIFEPKVAEGIFDDYLRSGGIETLMGYRITGADKKKDRIRAIRLESSDASGGDRMIRAKVYIDCSYEGDLMARAGVSYTVGREDNTLYGETYNGVQLMTQHQMPDGIDPYKTPGDPASGLLWGVSDAPSLPDGQGDSSVQAYNYRICLTDDPANRIPITRPADYDSTRYELLLRLFDAQPHKRSLNDYFIWSAMPGNKTDVNNRGGFSTDMIGMNHLYPEATYEERGRIVEAHKNYTQGLLWFFGHDARVPAQLREQMLRWGYPADEFVRQGHWTPQLYIRESRRMVSDYVMTQTDAEMKTSVTDGVGMAAYTMDSHNCRRIVIRKDGVAMVKNEGNVEVGGGVPYPISYRSIIPRKGECSNLLVPVCLSASHIAYGSIRMEPVFMVLAQSAAVAACQALETGNVHDVDVAQVQQLLKENPLLDGTAPDILIDDSDLSASVGWEGVSRPGGYGPSYLICGADAAPVRFIPAIPWAGSYKVYTYFHLSADTPAESRYALFDGAVKHDIVIRKADVVVQGQTTGEWVLLGTHSLPEGQSAYVEVSGACNTVADALLFIAEK